MHNFVCIKITIIGISSHCNVITPLQVKALDYISIFENKMPIKHETIIRKKIIAAHGEGLILARLFTMDQIRE